MSAINGCARCAALGTGVNCGYPLVRALVATSFAEVIHWSTGRTLHPPFVRSGLLRGTSVEERYSTAAVSFWGQRWSEGEFTSSTARLATGVMNNVPGESRHESDRQRQFVALAPNHEWHGIWTTGALVFHQ